MSDLLAHLVARTLTSTSAIRPRLEPLFAPAPAIDEQSTETIVRPRPSSSAPDVAVPSTTSPVLPPAPVETVVETSELAIEHREIISERKNGEKLAPPPQAKGLKPTQPPLPVAQTQPPKREEEAVVAPPKPERVKISRHFVPTTTPAAARFEKEEPSSAAPIVRVTIGRIDVRAAPAPAPPPRKPARSGPPALTLEAYLNSRKGGAR